MNTKSITHSKERMHLDRNDIYRIKKSRAGMTLSCENGILWVTQSGDLVDHLLNPGQKLVIKDHGGVLVEALRDVDFKIIFPEKAKLN